MNKKISKKKKEKESSELLKNARVIAPFLKEVVEYEGDEELVKDTVTKQLNKE